MDNGAYALVKQPDATVIGLAVLEGNLKVYLTSSDGSLREDATAGSRFLLEVVSEKQFKVTWRVSGS